VTVGIVIVSHSAALAAAAAELAQAVSTDEVRLAIAAGVDDPDHPLGTDAMRVHAAIESVDGEDGVLVLMDLGSAVLSAELARDLLPAATQDRLLLCEAPLVEGLVAAAVQAAAGADLQQVAAEARAGLAGKIAQLGPASSGDPGGDSGRSTDAGSDSVTDGGEGGGGEPEAGAVRLVVTNAHGLHARPAARVVAAVTALDADVSVRNLTSGSVAVPAHSLNGLITLGVRSGQEIEVRATGPDRVTALAVLEELAADHFGEAPQDVATGSTPAVAGGPAGWGGAGLLHGLAAAPGLAVGRVTLLAGAGAELRRAGPSSPRDAEVVDDADSRAGDPAEERARLETALAGVAAALRTTRRSVAARGGEDAAAIVDAHLLLLSDPALVDPTLAAIAAGTSAGRAWQQCVGAVVATYEALDDPYLAARAADVASIGEEVSAALAGAPPDGAEEVPPRLEGVLVGAELTPAVAARLDPGLVDAVVTAAGTPTSHAAILARALGIPAVVGVGFALTGLPAGRTVIVDGDAGTVQADPDAEVVAAARERIDQRRRSLAASRSAAQAAAVTRDGVTIAVLANAGVAQDAERALEEGADGIGLLRSELLFLDRPTPPDEDEQVAAYRAICEATPGRPVVLRTLDIGGDKPVPYVDMPEEANPFLGERGIRLTLARPHLLRPQLRAALRVAAEHPLRLLLPMVARTAEVHAARALLEEERRSLVEQGTAVATTIELGVMVEVPSLALAVEHVLAEVDFLSIGTNDLTQYVMAAERGNAAVAHLADPLEPGVLRLVAEVCRAAAQAGVPVAVCGGVAADPEVVELLLGLGVTELSVPPPSVGTIKDRVRDIDLSGAAELARRALVAPDAAAVRALLAPS
jgi:multiphosphoryl transfer protein